MEAKDSGLENPLSSIGECTRTRTERSSKTAYTLVNRNRWCFLGSIDAWMRLSEGEGELPKLAETYTLHIARDSYYELM
jgi:hypothetical protein